MTGTTNGGVPVANLDPEGEGQQSQQSAPSNDDGQQSQQSPQQSAQSAASVDEGQQAQQSAPKDGETPLEDLPKHWQDEIRNLRRENAAKRTAARDASTESADTLERLAAIESELESARAAEAEAKAVAQKTQILSDKGLPTKYVSMLTGENAEAWEQAANDLVELRGKKGTSPDPVQEAASNPTNPQTDKEKRAQTFFSGLD